ncbi:MAG: GNAT family N-acetyltransferase [Pseudomonadota bacterium]
MTRNISIRLAKASEKEALESLQRRASLANPGDREAILAHPDAIELPSGQIAAGRVFVAEWGGRPAGLSAILHRDDGDFDLDGLFVEPGLWRSGIGRALVEHAAAIAAQAGAGHLHVVGNPHAAGFYESLGFQTIETVATRFGPGLLMRRNLTAPSR